MQIDIGIEQDFVSLVSNKKSLGATTDSHLAQLITLNVHSKRHCRQFHLKVSSMSRKL